MRILKLFVQRRYCLQWNLKHANRTLRKPHQKVSFASADEHDADCNCVRCVGSLSMGGSLLRQCLGENSGRKVCTVKERCLPAFAATCGFQRATVMVPGVNAGFDSKGRGGLSGVATWQRDVTKGPRQLCLEDAIPDESRKERRLQFGINNDMLEEILSSFDMGCLCQEVPTDCKIHHAAKELLQKARRVQPADELNCIVIFVDGSFDPKKLTAAWAVAAFDFVSPEDIAWIGCMTGCLHERQFEGRLSAYTAELLGKGQHKRGGGI